MNNIIWAETIKTKTQEIKQQHPDLPEVETYQEFWNILTNQKNEALYHKIDKNNLDNISIVSDPSNNPETPETNIYAIQLLQPTTDGDKNIDLCYIRGKRKLEKFLAQYIRHDILHYQKEVQLSINETQESTEAILYTKEEVGVLKGDINDIVSEFEYSKEGVKEYYKQAKDLHKRVTKDYESSYKVIKDRQKNRKKPTLLEETMLSILEHKYNKDIRNIGQIDDTIKHLGKEYRKDLNSDVRQQNTKSNYLQLMYLQTQAQLLSAVLSSQAAQENFVDNPDRYMDIPVESSKDALFLRNAYDTMSKERFKINALLTDANFKNIKDKDNQTLQAYLTSVLIDGNNGQEPFVPSEEYKTEYNDILNAYPQLKNRMKPDVTDQGEKERLFRLENENTQETYNNPRNREKYVQKSDWWLLDRLTPWFITDGIDKLDIEPGTKKRLKTASWVAFLLGTWFLARKAVSNLFKSKEKKDKWRWRYVAGAAALFWWSYISSWNILNFKSLGTDIGNRFSSSPDNIESNNPNASAETLMTDWVNTMNIIFGGMTGSQINSLLIRENGKTKIDYSKAKTLIEANKSNISNADTRIKMIETLENSPNQNIIHLWVQALWLTKEKLEQQPNKKYDELVEQGLTKFFNIVKFMDNKEYTRWNPDMTDHIYAYMRGESWRTTDKLEKVWAFEREETLEDNDAIKNNINNITLLDEDQKKELYSTSLKVYKELSEKANYQGDFEFIEKNGKLHLKTYDKETPIDLQTKKIGSINLYTTYQLLKAANLTNRLQDIFAGKSEVDEPFNTSLIWRDIEFERNKLFSIQWISSPREFVKNKLDTEAVDAWRRGTLNEIAPSLEDNKQTYVDYLNSLPGRKA